MADAKQAWEEVGSRFSGLGLKLKMHFEQARGDEPSQTEAADAVRRLRSALDDAFEAVGAAVKDDAVKQDVREIGRSLTDAFSTTFSEVSDELRKAFRHNEPPGPSEPPGA